MTLGQRIAQKRKELGISQENLGERLGVSRQAIYKWESDSAMPEVEKLVALSRLFGVSVGWLLGVEEEAASGGGELSEEQLRLAEEIAARYAPSPRRMSVVKVSVAAAALCLCLVLWGFYQRLEDLTRNYSRLEATISQVETGVNGQISGVSNRVEQILKSQNNLTAVYRVDLLYAEPSSSQAFFQAYAVPKRYVEGMTAEFYAGNNEGRQNRPVPGEPGAGQRFSAELRCGLAEDIVLSVTFVYPDGTRQTQVLEHFYGLYGQTFPAAHADYALEEKTVEGRALVLTESERGVLYQNLDTAAAVNSAVSVAELESVRVGLFRNQMLVDWAVFAPLPGVADQESGFLTGEQWKALEDLRPGDKDRLTFYFPAQEIPLEAGDVLQEAVVLRDVYGRTAVRAGRAYGLDEQERGLCPLGLEVPDAYPDWALEDGSSICSLRKDP